MASAALQTFRRVITVSWPAHANRDGKELLLRTAREGHAQIMADVTAESGFPPQWEAYANTRGNTNLNSVILPGPIVYLYHYTTEVIEQALTLLQRLSPVRSGLYAKSHTIYVNGSPVGRAPKVLTEEVIISNPVPYARKIEVGKTRSGRSFVIQVPPRIYERAAKALRSRYRQVAKIEYTFANVEGRDRWPALIISPAESPFR
jgi:hypothetical protein